jgi:hypothetical protein
LSRPSAVWLPCPSPLHRLPGTFQSQENETHHSSPPPSLGPFLLRTPRPAVPLLGDPTVRSPGVDAPTGNGPGLVFFPAPRSGRRENSGSGAWGAPSSQGACLLGRQVAPWCAWVRSLRASMYTRWRANCILQLTELAFSSGSRFPGQPLAGPSVNLAGQSCRRASTLVDARGPEWDQRNNRGRTLRHLLASRNGREKNVPESCRRPT